MTTNNQSDRPWAAGTEQLLERLRDEIREKGEPGQTFSLRFNREQLDVKAFEQRLLLADVEPGSSRPQADTLQLDSLACQMKLLSSVVELSQRQGDEIAQQAGALGISYDLACRLAQTLTTEMHVLRANGQIGEANRLSDSRGRLEEVLRVTDSAIRAVTPKEEEDGNGKGLVYDWDKLVEPEEVKRKAIEAARSRQLKEKRARSHKEQSKTKLAAVLMAVAVICIASSYYFTTRTIELEPFSTSDFSDWYGIEQVVNRPPLLIVIVDQSRWNQLDEGKKREAFDEVMDGAQLAGYNRVEIRSTSDPDLARWEKGEGVTSFH